MDETSAPIPAAPADGGARDEGYSSVSEAVAELDRREKARAAERKAAKSATEAPADDADDGEDDAAPAKPVKAAKPEKADKPEKRAAADDGDDDAEDDDDDDIEADGAEDPDIADEDEDDKPEPKKPEPKPAPVKVKIRLDDDREVEATPDEVSTYVREATKERRAAEEHRQHLTQQAQALAQQGQLLQQMAQAMVGAEPDLALAQSDPGRYIAEQALYRQRVQALQHLQGTTSQAAQVAQQNQQQAFSQSVQREREALLKAIPELADPAKLAAFQGRVVKVAQRYGLTQQDLSNAFDHRSYLMLRDLARLADMEAERGNVRKKLAAAPPLKSPEQRAGAAGDQSQDIRAREAKKVFMRSAKTTRDVRRYLAATERS